MVWNHFARHASVGIIEECFAACRSAARINRDEYQTQIDKYLLAGTGSEGRGTRVI